MKKLRGEVMTRSRLCNKHNKGCTYETCSNYKSKGIFAQPIRRKQKLITSKK